MENGPYPDLHIPIIVWIMNFISILICFLYEFSIIGHPNNLIIDLWSALADGSMISVQLEWGNQNV